jgi:hypothetical protein
MTKETEQGLLDGCFDVPWDELPLVEPVDRSEKAHNELIGVIKEGANGRRKSEFLREQEAETTATCAGLDEVFAEYVEAKHARIGVNVGGKVSEITERDRADFAKLLAYAKEWELTFPDRGWPVAPQIVAAWLVNEYAKGEDIKRLYRSIGRVHEAHLNPVNDAAVRGVYEYLTSEPKTEKDN